MIRKGVAAIIFRKTDSGIKYLVLNRKLNWIGWEFLKGGCKKGENERICLSREMMEEIAVKEFRHKRTKFVNSFFYLKPLVKDEREWTGAAYRLYLVEVFSDKVKIDEDEHSGFKWVDKKEFLRLLTWDNQRELFEKVIKLYLKDQKK